MFYGVVLTFDHALCKRIFYAEKNRVFKLKSIDLELRFCTSKVQFIGHKFVLFFLNVTLVLIAFLIVNDT